MNGSTDDGQESRLDWRWEDLGWRDKVGSNSERITREALRRAVDIRDTNATDPLSLRARPVFLVDVLNKLCEVLNVETEDLWGKV